MLVSTIAPDFTAPALMPDGTINEQFSLYAHTHEKRTLLLFYPLDFTFVCPSELLTVAKQFQAFDERGIALIAISVDSVHAHKAWSQTAIQEGGLGGLLPFPLVSDLGQQITQLYQVVHPKERVALRASFLFDASKTIRHLSINDLALGRNFDELLRLVDALIAHETYGEVCPAQWKKGEATMTPSSEGVKSYLSTHYFHKDF